LAIAEGLTVEQQHMELVEWFYSTYKAIHGVKPRWVDTDVLSVDQMLELVEGLGEESKRLSQQVTDDDRGYSDADVQAMMDAGASDMATAIKWAKQA
jgi:hypothetical protein